MSDVRTFYTRQSPITDPGPYASLYDSLPGDIAGLANILQGLIIHFNMDGPLLNCTIPSQRRSEIDTRYASAILERLLELDDRPLTEVRLPQKRFIGSCTDFSVLCASILRHQGTAARVRSGFGAYFDAGYYDDHMVVEYWNAGEERWILADVEMAPVHLQAYPIDFDVLDVPRDQFVTGGDAWQRYRRSEIEPRRFGLGPTFPYNGWEFVLQKLLQDLAALNRHETLCWDNWGMGREADQLTEEDLKLLDHAAELIQAGDAAFDEMRALYEQTPRLRITGEIFTFTPAGGSGGWVPVTIRT